MSTTAYIASLATSAISMKGLTVSNVVKALADFAFAAADIPKAMVATITARSAGVMYTTDGTDPTATLGHMLAQNATVVIYGSQKIQALKFLREAGVDAAVTITLEQ